VAQITAAASNPSAMSPRHGAPVGGVFDSRGFMAESLQPARRAGDRAMLPICWERVEQEKLHEGVERQVIWGQQGTLARFRFARGTHVSAHAHPSEQFTCMESGTMRIRVGQSEQVLRAGDILVIPAEVPHEVWVQEDSEVLDFFAPARDDWKQGRHQYLVGR
jgi:quercetin dioxygenase-like cupin family protein